MRVKTRRTLAGLAVLIAAFVAVLVIFDDSEPKPPPQAGCPDGVFMYFRDDDTMRSVARILQDDLRVRNLTAKTKQQMMDAYNELGDNVPRALRELGSTRMPPALAFNVGPGFNRTDVKEQLKNEFKREAAVIDCLDIAAAEIGQPV
jgi:hypothetical protein